MLSPGLTDVLLIGAGDGNGKSLPNRVVPALALAAGPA
jgi:hypothetical protein